MENTHTLRLASMQGLAATVLALGLITTQAQAGVSQGRLQITATVIEACSLNLALPVSVQAQPIGRFKEVARVSSCDNSRPANSTNVVATSAKAVAIEPPQRGQYNLDIDEASGHITLFF
jgi:hypothetical protein